MQYKEETSETDDDENKEFLSYGWHFDSLVAQELPNTIEQKYDDDYHGNRECAAKRKVYFGRCGRRCGRGCFIRMGPYHRE